MTTGVQHDSELREQFQRAARERRRNPGRLLADVMREYLESYRRHRLSCTAHPLAPQPPEDRAEWRALPRGRNLGADAGMTSPRNCPTIGNWR